MSAPIWAFATSTSSLMNFSIGLVQAHARAMVPANAEMIL
jgi:hypothetical protein